MTWPTLPDNLAPYQVALLVLSTWLVLALAPQIPILARTSRGIVDWSVFLFRASLLVLGACVAVSYFFNLSRWLIVGGWIALDVAASINAVYIVQRGLGAARGCRSDSRRDD